MCGIFAYFDSIYSIPESELSRLLRYIDCRGPDYQSALIKYKSRCKYEFQLKSSVLHTRGDAMYKQPSFDNDGNVLMFNGQVYRYLDEYIDSSVSDTRFLLDRLWHCTSSIEVANVFAQIDGPFAFIYWHNKTNSLIYGRDLFGRKSLCALQKNRQPQIPIIISSIADESLESADLKWIEVDCSGIHSINYSDQKSPTTTTFHWDIDEIYPPTNKCPRNLYSSIGSKAIRIESLQPLNLDQRLPVDFSNCVVDTALSEFDRIFAAAVRDRYSLNIKTCLVCRHLTTITECIHSKVAVAFSGGLDSTLLALALDKIVKTGDAIDLITVAFKKDSPDRKSVGSAYVELRKLCPNRNWRLILCDVSIQELQQQRDKSIRSLILPCDSVFDDGIGCACWFVGRATGRIIDISTDLNCLSENIDELIQYDIDHNHMKSVYTSPASMLFVGSSIDEQLGGYSSHRIAWQKSGAEGLLNEISFLMRRLSSRNLGRDDRVYCHHGREIKLPFLDNRLVSFLNRLPIGLKMNLDEALESGPKKLLRMLAISWGLEKTGKRVKRAMQFGTRIANLEGTKEKGDDICVRLRNSDKYL